MSGPRIMVLQLRDIIKIGMIALIGIILIGFLIFFLVPKGHGATGDIYTPGTYAAQIILYNKPVDVEVTVSGKEITAIELKNMNTKQETFYPLFKTTLDELSPQIIKYQTTKIASKPETAVTSKILLDAVNAALEQAAVTNSDNR